jgi:hypothetical protein
MARADRSVKALCFMLTLASAAGGCKDAQEKCEDARVAAERSWGDYIAALEAAHAQAVAVQAKSKLSMTREVEPRISARASQAASARFERGVDGWHRAFVAAQAEECTKDALCTQLRHDEAVARDTQAELEAKLRPAKLALTGVRSSAERARDSADVVTPDPDDARVATAKRSSAAVYETCHDAN